MVTKLANQTVHVGLDAAVDAKRVWETDDYATIRTGSGGDFVTVVNPFDKWLD